MIKMGATRSNEDAIFRRELDFGPTLNGVYLTPTLSQSGILSNDLVEPVYDLPTQPPMKRLAWWLTVLAGLCGLWLLIATQWSIVTRSNRRTVSYIEWRRLIFIAWMLVLAGCSAIPLIHRHLIGLIGRLRRVTAVGRRRTTI